MESKQFDVVVVGAGSGGYAAARTARELGASVALVDHGPLGGLCILRGCMPSKTLLASSNRAYEVAHGPELGITAGPVAADMPYILARKREIIGGFADYRIEALRTFPLFEGLARFVGPTTLEVGGELRLEAKNVVIATGSVVATPVLPGLVETGYMDSDSALERERLPGSMTVLGGGYVAAELGQYFARLGVRTTMLIRAQHLFSGEDTDVGEAITASFRDEGIRVVTGTQLSHAERRGDEKVVHFLIDGEPHSVAADEIFYALGRLPNLEGLDLDVAGVTAHPITGIETGPDMRTANPNVFAVGDVTGDFLLVHVAIYQGELAARNAVCGTHERADYTLQKTHAIFTDPQIAVTGLSEKDLQREGRPYVRGSYPFADHGKAISIGKTTGFVKMLAEPDTGRILGGAVVGAEGSDLIHEVTVALNYGATVQEFVRIPHLHPTLAEIWTYPAEEIVALLAERRAVAAAV